MSTIKVDELPTTKDEMHKRLLRECYEKASESKHTTTHNAALLVKNGKVILYGVNNLPPGVKEVFERLQGDNRHTYPNHAERDAIYKAAREGVRTQGLEMVMPWIPCIACANAIITAGIQRLIVHKQMIARTREGWRDELNESIKLLAEAGVDVQAYDGHLGVKAFMHGVEWES